MLRRLALTLLAATCLASAPGTPRANAQADDMKTIVGPAQIYYADADTVLFLATKEWISKGVRHQEKLLRTQLRLAYWRDHIAPDMRRVFDTLGYPTGRVLTTPVGHTEELWYYGQLSAPVRFRDGVLQNASRVDEIRAGR